jgi:hypothetical protein
MKHNAAISLSKKFEADFLWERLSSRDHRG